MAQAHPEVAMEDMGIGSETPLWRSAAVSKRGPPGFGLTVLGARWDCLATVPWVRDQNFGRTATAAVANLSG